jgi:hypothetical protein
MSRGRGAGGVALLVVMTLLGGTACGRYGPPVRTPEVAATEEMPTGSGADDSSVDDRPASGRKDASTAADPAEAPTPSDRAAPDE